MCVTDVFTPGFSAPHVQTTSDGRRPFPVRRFFVLIDDATRACCDCACRSHETDGAEGWPVVLKLLLVCDALLVFLFFVAPVLVTLFWNEDIKEEAVLLLIPFITFPTNPIPAGAEEEAEEEDDEEEEGDDEEEDDAINAGPDAGLNCCTGSLDLD